MPIVIPKLFVAAAFRRSEAGMFFYQAELRPNFNLWFDIVDPWMSAPPLGIAQREETMIAGVSSADLVLVAIDSPVMDNEVLNAAYEAQRRGKKMIGYCGAYWPVLGEEFAEKHFRATTFVEQSGGKVFSEREKLYAALHVFANEFHESHK